MAIDALAARRERSREGSGAAAADAIGRAEPRADNR